MNAIAQLAEHIIRNIGGILGHKIHADPLGPDQAGDLFDLVDQCLWRAVKQQVRLIEEEHQLWLVGVADLWQFFKQFRQQPQQERRI